MRVIEKVYGIIPVYTADVSGVCSALYELGGMVVMHDPSGCNSTYNTHDETRWYNQDSNIFISALTDRDAVFGDDGRLIENVVDAARRLKPRFIALCASPIPYLNGTDFAAVARLIEKETSIPTFGVKTNGMHDYGCGVSAAWLALAEKFLPPKNSELQTPHSELQTPNSELVNILGLTPLDFAAPNSTASLKKILTDGGFTVGGVWAMDDAKNIWGNLLQSPTAAVNLVVSLTGLPLAKFFAVNYHIPYVVGLPIGAMRGEIFAALTKAASTKENIIVCHQRGTNKTDSPLRIFIGEPVMMGSLAYDHYLKSGENVKVICPLENAAELIDSDTDKTIIGEFNLENELKDYAAEEVTIVADPLYRPIIPAQCKFIPLPHLAFSGRQYLNEIRSEELGVRSYGTKICFANFRLDE